MKQFHLFHLTIFETVSFSLPLYLWIFYRRSQWPLAAQNWRYSTSRRHSRLVTLLFLVAREWLHLVMQWFQCKNNFHMDIHRCNFPRIKRIFYFGNPYIYLARAVELSSPKIIIAISFTVSVTITCVNTSAHHQTIFVQAGVPVIIGFFFLNEIKDLISFVL